MVLYCHFRRRASLLCREARLSGCSALHIARGLGPACATAETQEIAWQGRAATWVVLAPEHWTRAASLTRPFENRRQMPFIEQRRRAGIARRLCRSTAGRWAMSGEITLLLSRALTTKLAC